MVDHEESVKNEEKEKEADEKEKSNEPSQKEDEKEKQQQTKGKWVLKKTLTDREILSQAILFLAAGYETTASTLVLIAYNLATNPECQYKLCEEIDEILEKNVKKKRFL